MIYSELLEQTEKEVALRALLPVVLFLLVLPGFFQLSTRKIF